MHIETLIDAHAVIGESPLWDPVAGVLYWADIKAPALYRYDPAGKNSRSWSVTGDLGAFALMEDGGAVVALREGVHRLDLESGALEMLAPAPFDTRLFRFNEGICDSAGRFWIGVMFDPLDGSPEPRAEALHSFTLAGGLRREEDFAELHNGFAFSPDQRRFFLSHSREDRIYVRDFAPEEGWLGDACLFASMDLPNALPDGAAMDEQGGYWCALHGVGKLRRFNPDGSVARDVDLPVSQPTMCAFGGPDLDTLYITSARDQLSETELREQPLAGGLFRMRPGVRGAPKAYLVR